MLAALGRLLLNLFAKRRLDHAVYGESSEALDNTWYRLRHWKRSHFLAYKAVWDRDWRTFAEDVKLAGVTVGTRERDFFLLADARDFKLLLRREPDNPVDPDAIVVIGTATVDGRHLSKQLGYVSADVAELLAGEEAIDVRPQAVYLPHGTMNYGLRMRILTRSAAYLKRQHSSKTRPSRKGAVPRVVPQPKSPSDMAAAPSTVPADEPTERPAGAIHRIISIAPGPPKSPSDMAAAPSTVPADEPTERPAGAIHRIISIAPGPPKRDK